MWMWLAQISQRMTDYFIARERAAQRRLRKEDR